MDKPGRTERIKARTERLEQEAAEIERMKNMLSTKHGILRDTKFDKAWHLAWDYGHSAGLHEVSQYFDDLAELIK